MSQKFRIALESGSFTKVHGQKVPGTPFAVTRDGGGYAITHIESGMKAGPGGYKDPKRASRIAKAFWKSLTVEERAAIPNGPKKGAKKMAKVMLRKLEDAASEGFVCERQA